MSLCSICQFEDGHSRECRLFVEPRNPMNKLDEINNQLESAFDWADQVKDSEILMWRVRYGFTPEELISNVLRFCKEFAQSCVPNEKTRPSSSFYRKEMGEEYETWKRGWNACREEMLRNINEGGQTQKV